MATLKIAAVFLFLFLMCFGFGLLIYVAKTKLDLIEVYLKDNAVMIGKRRWWGGNSYNDRIARTLAIGSLLVLSKLYIRRGWLIEQELAPIPLVLKRWIMAPSYLGMLFLSICIIIWAWEQF